MDYLNKDALQAIRRENLQNDIRKYMLENITEEQFKEMMEEEK